MQATAKTFLPHLCRGAIAFIWFYHGLVPKLLGPDADELSMNLALGVSRTTVVTISYVAGAVELTIAGAVLLFRRQSWPLWLTLILMPALLLYVAVFTPRFLMSAFNAVTINVATMVLAIVAITLERNEAV